MEGMGVPPGEEPAPAVPPPEPAAAPTVGDEIDVDEAAPEPPARTAASEEAASAPPRRVRKTPREGAVRGASRASATGTRSSTAEQRERKARP
jgi:hypothetical protein